VPITTPNIINVPAAPAAPAGDPVAVRLRYAENPPGVMLAVIVQNYRLDPATGDPIFIHTPRQTACYNCLGTAIVVPPGATTAQASAIAAANTRQAAFAPVARALKAALDSLAPAGTSGGPSASRAINLDWYLVTPSGGGASVFDARTTGTLGGKACAALTIPSLDAASGGGGGGGGAGLAGLVAAVQSALATLIQAQGL
jgi:hypothetical protein